MFINICLLRFSQSHSFLLFINHRSYYRFQQIRRSWLSFSDSLLTRIDNFFSLYHNQVLIKHKYFSSIILLIFLAYSAFNIISLVSSKTKTKATHVYKPLAQRIRTKLNTNQIPSINLWQFIKK